MQRSSTDLLLLPAHRDRVLVAVAVDADLVPGRDACVELLRERLDRVPRPFVERLTRAWGGLGDVDDLEDLRTAEAGDLHGTLEARLGPGP
jgi:hypothetical protein